MKRILFAIFLLSSLLNAATQQEYFTPHNIFVYNGMYFSQINDTSVEVYSDAFYGLPVPDPVVIPETVQDSAGNIYTVTRIGNHAFHSNNINCKDFILPATLLEIGEHAFQGNGNLRNIYFPVGLRRIETMAFASCSLGGTITLPDSLYYLSPHAFYISYDTITEYYINGCPRFCTMDGILYNNDTTELLLAPRIVTDTFHVPQHTLRLGENALINCDINFVVLNEGLREIGCWVFPSNITNLEIPASVTHIDGMTTSCNASSLTITVDSASRHYKTNDQMLLSYNGDTLVQAYGAWFGTKGLPEGLKVISTGALWNLNTLDRIDLPYSLEEIGDYAFHRSSARFYLPYNLRKVGERILGTGVTSLALPNTLTDIADYAFADSQLDTVVLSDSLRVIPRGMFFNTHLRKVTLGRYVEHIMPEAFTRDLYGASTPLKINSDNYLPATLRTIGRDAFRGCNIARVKFHHNPDSVGEYAFNRTQRVFFDDTVPPVVFDSSFMAGCDIYLPCNGTAAFTAAPGWNSSFNYLESPCPPTAIDDATPDAPFSVTTAGSLLTVVRAKAVEVSIYDILGRRLLHAPASTTTLLFHVPAAGLYIVKAGAATSKALMMK